MFFLKINTISIYNLILFLFQLIKAFLSADSMDNFVFCIAQRKIAPKLSKEMNDLVRIC